MNAPCCVNSISSKCQVDYAITGPAGAERPSMESYIKTDKYTCFQQIVLDSRTIWYIIYLTHQGLVMEDRREASRGREGRVSQGTLRPAPPSREGGRRELPAIHVLRSTRRDAGALRDATASPGRRPQYRRDRTGLRRQSTVLLSAGRGFRYRGTAGTWTSQTRPQARPQVLEGGPGLRAGTSRGISNTPLGRSGQGGRLELRDPRASSHVAARCGPSKKKRPAESTEEVLRERAVSNSRTDTKNFALPRWRQPVSRKRTRMSWPSFANAECPVGSTWPVPFVGRVQVVQPTMTMLIPRRRLMDHHCSRQGQTRR